jgi:hypothetical protein
MAAFNLHQGVASYLYHLSKMCSLGPHHGRRWHKNNCPHGQKPHIMGKAAYAMDASNAYLKDISSTAVVAPMTMIMGAITAHKLLDNIQDGLIFANIVDQYAQKENLRIKPHTTTVIYLFINKKSGAYDSDQLHYTFKMNFYKNERERTEFQIKLPKTAL